MDFQFFRSKFSENISSLLRYTRRRKKSILYFQFFPYELFFPSLRPAASIHATREKSVGSLCFWQNVSFLDRFSKEAESKRRKQIAVSCNSEYGKRRVWCVIRRCVRITHTFTWAAVRGRFAAETVKSLVVVANTISAKPQILA